MNALIQTCAAGACVVWLSAGGAAAQVSLLYTLESTATSFDSFGQSVSGIEDVNGDNVNDFAIGAPTDSDDLTQAGSVWVYSGATGTLIRTIRGIFALDRLGTSVGGGIDYDGDGDFDLIAGAPGATGNKGAVYVYSVLDGTVLAQFPQGAPDALFGTAVDGIPAGANDASDFVLGGAPGLDLPGAPNAGSAFLYDAPIGGLRRSYVPVTGGQGFGGALSFVGDVNNDGHADFVIGAQNSNRAGLTNNGTVEVYSTNSTNPIRVHDGSRNFQRFGASVSGVGDINKDGFDDYIVGSPGDTPGSGSGAGSASVFSGKDGKRLLFLEGTGAANDAFGTSVAGIGDVDGDTFPDFAVGEPLGAAGRVWVFSGVYGNVIDLLEASDMPVPAFGFGTSVSGLGDINGDGLGDFIVGAPTDGSAFVFTGTLDCTQFDRNDDGSSDFVDLTEILDGFEVCNNPAP